MAILITGGSGFLGSALIPRLLQKGHRVYALSRHPPEARKNLIPLVGDIIEPNLGLKEVPDDIQIVIHCAALLSFKIRDKDKLYQTNYQGTKNLLDFMTHHKMGSLFHISTAYLFHQNDYETSKEMAEQVIQEYPEIKTTIIRPSVIIGDSELKGLPPVSGLYLGIAAIDKAKRWFERKTGAWAWQVKIRVKGREDGNLNLIPVDRVADLVIEAIEKEKDRILYATHPTPVPLKALERLISDAVGAKIQIKADFKANAIEKLASALIKELSPYLLSKYNFPSNIECPPLTEEFLAKTIEAFLRIHPPRSLGESSID